MSRQPNILERIQSFALSTPNRVAVAFDEATLTYTEINQQANQLAHFLQALGVSSETPVALCLERSLDLPVAILGIFKSGGTYIPLDPEHPKGRLHYLIEATETKVVITQESLRAHFDEINTKVIVLENAREQIKNKSSENLPLPDPHHVAYLMFTSGTSGKPKGVQIEHDTLAERFPISPYHLLMDEKDNLAAITAVSWNPSVYENLYTLANGSKLVLCTTEVTRDPVLLQAFIKAKNITFMRAVPSLLRALIEAGWSGKEDMTIVSHGEKLDSKLAEQLSSKGKGVYNTYGSTEATIFSMVQVTSGDKRVIPGERLLILDESLKPVPTGEVGEIHFFGSVIARGYFNDPALTAEKFITNSDGTRLYKTGDLARKLQDGSIEFLGRADNQVKIRGQRIELGEVEAAIANYPLVKSVVVHTSEDSAGGARLVAYIIPVDTIEIFRLRSFLTEVLPSAMIPSSFVCLDNFPLNANGKINRQALPKPSRELSDFGIAFVPAETKTQSILAQIFSQVLNYDQIGLDDHFFMLGGHSLLAALVCSRIKEEFLLPITLERFFQLPTVRALSIEIDRRQKSGERSVNNAITRLTDRKNRPLSFAQERLWFMSKFSKDTTEYNLPLAIRLKGELNLQALNASLFYILNRHEALRTSFHQDDQGRTFQNVHEAVAFDLVPIKASVNEIQMQILEDTRTPFDLSKSPLIRTKLFEVKETDFVLYINMHHIASDGWSKAIFKREMVEAYGAFARAREPDFKILPVQYLDFALWHKTFLDQTELNRQIGYWVKELSALETLNMPTDRPRPKVQTQNGAQETLVIGPHVLARLNALALKQNASLYMVILTAFNVLLHRYSGQTDIAIGSPISGRVRPETEGLIGFFVNTIVMRSQVDPKASFLSLLEQVKGKALKAYDHQDLSFERLVSEINPERDLSRYPLIQTILALQNTPYDEVVWDGLEAANFNFRNETTRFDLELHIWERSEGLRCHLIYNTDLFDQWRMAQFIQHFQSVLDYISQFPETSVTQVPLLSELEKKKILIDWNQTKKIFPQNQCIHHLIEARTVQYPDALAISSHEGRLTFDELNQRANQLAHHLIKRGTKPGERIALCLPKSLDLVVTMLGILKVGAAYIPLDPEYPEDRLQFMLSDSKASMLVTHATVSPCLHRNIPLVLMDGERHLMAAEPTRNPHADVSEDMLAYIIFTSGSTGRPNGVMVPHRGLVNLVYYYQDTFGVTVDDRSSYFSSPSFDASGFEVWGHLTAGASLFIPERETRMSIVKLMEWCESNKITICFLTTALMEQLLDMKPASSLRMLSVGGDRLRVRPPKDYIPLLNFYGPTENTIISTASVVEPRDTTINLPSIGRPIANQQAYILDAHMNPVPIGVAGELYLGGIGLAHGYIDRPDLTAKKFISNPFGAGKLYKSGDLARFLPDGQIDFLGRLDFQVKVRGYRIELEEINNVILDYPSVKEAITIVREDVPGDKRLVSYIVTDGQAQAPELESMVVDQWQQLYEREYAQSTVQNIESNIIGWNSSFTGTAIPDVAMYEWVDCTVAAIKKLKPKRIFEVGCGSGLLLFPLFESVEQYTATDISSVTIDKIRQHVKSDKVFLHAGGAHDLSWIPSTQKFDTVIINSVIQYFPSESYLSNVIKDLVPRMMAGGRLFIGDVRNFDLMHAFHLEIELHRSADEDVTGNLRQRVEARVQLDKELLLSPRFFQLLAKEIPRISSVEIHPKKGQHKTEMNMFRYDVILHIETPVQQMQPTFFDFKELGGTLEAVDNILEKMQTPVVIRGIPDRRNANVISAFKDLHGSENNERIGQFRARFSGKLGLDIDELYALAERCGVHLETRLAPKSQTFEAFFSRQKVEGPTILWESPMVKESMSLVSNDPLQHRRITSVRTQMREHLNHKLPDYMIPSSLVFLDALPLTTNGKVDRKALPVPSSERPELLAAYVPPQTEVEHVLADIFTKTLGLDVVGIHDNFFELGGHSLLAVQLVSLIEDRLGTEIALTTLFEGPTVAKLSSLIQQSPKVTNVVADEMEEAERLPLTSMDVNFYFVRILMKTSDHAWYQVLELEVPKLNQTKLEAALLYAVNKHPIARGRLSSVTGLGKDVYWDVSKRLTKAPLKIYQAHNIHDLQSIREKIVTTPFSMDEAPTCRFAWIQGERSDRLLLRYNHGGMDASGLQCMLNSVMAHYTGASDPVKRVLPFSNEELLQHYHYQAGALIQSGELAHLRGLFPNWFFPTRKGYEVQTSLFKPREIFPAMISSMGGSHKAGCSVVEVEFSTLETEALKNQAMSQQSTLDRLFMVGILRGAKLWNKTYAPRPGRVEAYWAVNLRPPKLFDSIVANQFGWARVRTVTDEQEAAWEKEILNPSSDFLLRGALDWIQSVNTLHRLTIPNFLRRFLIWLGNMGAPSMFISNTLTVSLNESEQNPLSEAFGVSHMQNHSRFGKTNRPIIVIGRVDDRFRLRMTFPLSQFNRDGAKQFLELCKKTIVGFKA